MTLDALRGKGAYRCGCGARVKIDSVAPKYSVAECVAILANGARCSEFAVTPRPLSVCEAHKQYRRPEAERFALSDDAVRDAAQEYQLAHRADRARGRDYPRVVYFIRRADLIKIGYTADFALRMAALLPDDILAVEPGDRELEQRRHRQFHKSRVSGEWFRPTAALGTLIRELQDAHGPLLKRLTDGGWRGEIFTGTR